jgi:DNA replication protein DnaC
MTTIPIQDLWHKLGFISECSSLTAEQIEAVLPVLRQESSCRETRRIRYLLSRSGIKRVKRLEDFDWTFNPKLPRTDVMALTRTDWLQESHNAVLIGPSGVGKSHLASAICYQAVQRGIPTIFLSCFDLVEKLRRARSRSALVDYFSTVKLLCLDELGYVFPTSEQANDIFQIISRRSELTSTIVTTNLIPSKWDKIFEPATATAILDRLSLNGKFITFEGRSYRSKK